MLLELCFIHFLQVHAKLLEESLDAALEVLWLLLALDQHAEADAVQRHDRAAPHDVAKLLLGAQLVVARFVGDLGGQEGFGAEHSVVAVSGVKDVLDAVIDVLGVGQASLVDVVAAFRDDERSSRRPERLGKRLRLQSVLQQVGESKSVFLVEVSVSNNLKVKLLQHLRIEESHVVWSYRLNFGKALFVQPSLVRAEPAPIVSDLLIWLFKVPILDRPDEPFLGDVETILSYLEIAHGNQNLLQKDRHFVIVPVKTNIQT